MEKNLLLIQGLNGQSVKDVVSEVYELERASWDKSMRTSNDNLSNRLHIFSDGLWRLYWNLSLVSYMFFIRLNKENVNGYETWSDYCADGTCNNHTKEGDVLFGVSIGSIKRNMGNKIFDMGINKISEGVYEEIKKIHICGRIPTLSLNFLDAAAVSSLDLESLGYSLIMEKNILLK